MFKQFSCNTIMKTKYHRPINLLLLILLILLLGEPVMKLTATAKILKFYEKCQVRYYF